MKNLDWIEDNILTLVGMEVDSAQKKHPPLHSHHEAYAVLLEEVEELWDEIKKKAENRNNAKIRREAVQVAAMAVRLIVDTTEDE